MRLGYGPLYNFNTEASETANYFSINIRVAEPLIIGFGNRGEAMLFIKYDIPALPVRAVLGYAGNDRVLIGAEAIVFGRQVGGIFTEFKIAPEYLFSADDLGKGRLQFGLMLGIGF